MSTVHPICSGVSAPLLGIMQASGEAVTPHASVSEAMDSEDEARDAIFMIQPDEMGCYKSLRRVADQVFTRTGRFFPSSMMYTHMDSADEGVNCQLRAMLFVPSKSTKRGVRRTDNADRDLDVNVNDLYAMKQTQRQSKQKERCENRLMSLLLATIYDPATKRCRLVQDSAAPPPPLKLRKVDKNGQTKNVSNYTDVSLSLQNSMASILSTYSEAVKRLNQILSDHFGILPSLFMIISRSFMAIAKVEASGSPNQDPSHLRTVANESLDYCMSWIQNFITTWERRNFSTHNPLLHSLEAVLSDGHYKSVHTLLKTMIIIVPPTDLEPYGEQFRFHYIHVYGSPRGSACQKRGNEQCPLGSKCAGTGISRLSKPKSQITDMTDYLQFVAALSECAKRSPAFQFDDVDQSIDEQGFSTATWRCSEGLCVLHRMETFSSHIRNQRLSSCKTKNPNAPTHLGGVYWDIARYWPAIGRSNHMTWELLDKLNIPDCETLKETAVELIFGGAIASIAFLKRETDILPICARLRSKKGPMVVNTKKFTSHAGTDNNNTPVEPPLGQTRELKINDEDQTDSSVPSDEDVTIPNPKHSERPTSTHAVEIESDSMQTLQPTATMRQSGMISQSPRLQLKGANISRNLSKPLKQVMKRETISKTLKPIPNTRKRYRKEERENMQSLKKDRIARIPKSKRARKRIA